MLKLQRDHAYKILTEILNERIKKYTENIIGEFQCGLGTTEEQETTDKLFVRKQNIVVL